MCVNTYVHVHICIYTVYTYRDGYKYIRIDIHCIYTVCIYLYILYIYTVLYIHTVFIYTCTVYIYIQTQCVSIYIYTYAEYIYIYSYIYTQCVDIRYIHIYIGYIYLICIYILHIYIYIYIFLGASKYVIVLSDSTSGCMCRSLQIQDTFMSMGKTGWWFVGGLWICRTAITKKEAFVSWSTWVGLTRGRPVSGFFLGISEYHEQTQDLGVPSFQRTHIIV